MTNTDKATALHAQLVGEVERLVSGEDWAAMLEIACRFHRYSFRNSILIRMQRPEATRVAGFNTWKSLGHHVRKGEKGIAILAPCTYRRVSDPGASVGDDPVEGREDAAQEVRVLRGFRVTHVFDVGQTEGPALPDVRPELLTGAAPEGLFDSLREQIAERGYHVEIVPPEQMPSPGANGTTEWATHRVCVRDDLEPAQRVKTTAHELAHVLMHEVGSVCSGRSRIEVEAESVAYVVMRAAGVDSADYSFAYVARWADGKTDLVAQTGERVVATARLILDALTDKEVAA